MTLIKRALPLAASLIVSLPSAAFAHSGVGDTQGLLHGFSHPIGGLDHILAMLGVGLLAARLGGRALWLVPCAFVAMMAAGGAIGLAGIALPFVETAIAASVIVIGLAIALRVPLPVLAAAMLVGFFAIFHGHAHGAEMPAVASGIAYGLGFTLATALLHVSGIALGLSVDRLARTSRLGITQAGGGVMALAGLLLLAGVL